MSTNLSIINVGKDFYVPRTSSSNWYLSIPNDSTLSNYNSMLEDDTNEDTKIIKNFPELILTESLPNGYIVIPYSIESYNGGLRDTSDSINSASGLISWMICFIDDDYLEAVARVVLMLDSFFNPVNCYLETNGGPK